MISENEHASVYMLAYDGNKILKNKTSPYRFEKTRSMVNHKMNVSSSAVTIIYRRHYDVYITNQIQNTRSKTCHKDHRRTTQTGKKMQTYTYKYIYIYIHIYIHIYMYILIYLYIYMHTYLHVYRYTYINLCMYLYIWLCMSVTMHAYLLYTTIHMYTHIFL